MEENETLEKILYAFLAKVNNYQERSEIIIDNEEDTLYLWLALGKYLGIDAIFSNIKVVVSEDLSDIRRIVAMVASPSKEIIEKVTDARVITDELIEKYLVELENKPKQ